MKLPKCPHCEKLMIGVITTGSYLKPVAQYVCPEKLTTKEPDWVEVLEV